MTLFSIFLNRFMSKKTPIYSKWCLDYDHSIQDRKIFLANIDNCECFENIEKSNKSIDIIKNDNKKLYDEYLYL
jgi:hypothetical protein